MLRWRSWSPPIAAMAMGTFSMLSSRRRAVTMIVSLFSAAGAASGAAAVDGSLVCA
jgi:hypothetical protein